MIILQTEQNFNLDQNVLTQSKNVNYVEMYIIKN